MMKTAKLFLLGCVLGGVLCRPDAAGNTMYGVATEALRGIRDEGHKVLMSGIENSGKAGRGIVGAIGSVANYGLQEVTDYSARTQKFATEALPIYSGLIKDNAFDTLGTVADHATNVKQRILAGIQEAILVTDAVSNTAFEESVKVMKSGGETVQSLMRLGGTVGTKVNSYGQRAMDTAGDIVNQPGEYLNPMLMLASLNKAGQNAWNTAGNVVTASGKYVKPALETLNNVGQTALSTALDTAGNVVTESSKYVKPALDTLTNAGQTALNTAGNVVAESRKYLSPVWQSLSAWNPWGRR